jgi:hypothetical protein
MISTLVKAPLAGFGLVLASDLYLEGEYHGKKLIDIFPNQYPPQAFRRFLVTTSFLYNSEFSII